VKGRLAQIALAFALLVAMGGLTGPTGVLGQDGCCDDCEQPSCPDGASDCGAPVPCSRCACPGCIAPAIVAQGPIPIANVSEVAMQATAPDVHPEARFLPGVFRPPRHAA
jgi:hypothetical protein